MDTLYPDLDTLYPDWVLFCPDGVSFCPESHPNPALYPALYSAVIHRSGICTTMYVDNKPPPHPKTPLFKNRTAHAAPPPPPPKPPKTAAADFPLKNRNAVACEVLHKIGVRAATQMLRRESSKKMLLCERSSISAAAYMLLHKCCVNAEA